MELSLWQRTDGTWINVATVVLGTLVGLALGNRLPERMQRVIMQAVGLTTLFMGISMASSLPRGTVGDPAGFAINGVVLGLVTLVIGGILGEWWRIEERLGAFGDWLRSRVRGGGRFTEGFVAASLLFCIGPMAILGSLDNGLKGQNSILVVKSTLDGLAALALASSLGVGVGFSTLVIILYQGGISLAAGSLTTLIADPANDPQLLLVEGVGGIMILGIAINLLDLTKIKVASLLPALAIAPLARWLLSLWLGG